MAVGTKKSDRNKKLILIGLVFILAVAVMRQLLQSSPAAKPAAKAQNGTVQVPAGSSPANARVGQRNAASSSKQAQLEQLLAEVSPLDLTGSAAGTAGVEVNRNIFAYYVRPPDPLPPPPRPPPIALRFLQPQSAVAGTPKSVVLTVTGEGFPDDAQILLGGVPKPTKRLSDKQLSTEITPDDYSVPRTINVEVKSAGKPGEIFSNPISFVAQAPPEPPFKFIGLIGDLGVFEVTVQGGIKEHVRLRRGQMIGGAWRIDSISATGVEVTDTRYDIKKRVSL